MRTCLPSYIQCWPMAEPVYGARYLKPAESEAGAATMVVYSIAPAAARVFRAAAIVEPFWPIATEMRDAVCFGSPVFQLSGWFMIASRQTVVLPDCRAPIDN